MRKLLENTAPSCTRVVRQTHWSTPRHHGSSSTFNSSLPLRSLFSHFSSTQAFVPHPSSNCHDYYNFSLDISTSNHFFYGNKLVQSFQTTCIYLVLVFFKYRVFRISLRAPWTNLFSSFHSHFTRLRVGVRWLTKKIEHETLR